MNSEAPNHRLQATRWADMNRAFLLTVLLSASAQAAPCLSYSGSVTLSGVLSRQTFPEEPNYESIEGGDRPASYLFVKPRSPFCVEKGTEPFDEYEAEMEEVQLVFVESPKKAYYTLRPFLGKEVICTGSLYHAENGHHHSPVLLWGAKCRAAQQGTSSDAKKASAFLAPLR